MTKTETAPGIGTPEGAVRACVALIAAVTGQPEDLTERYLDLYYQTRRAAEDEAARKTILKCWDVGMPMEVLPDTSSAPVGADKLGMSRVPRASESSPQGEGREKPAAKTGPSETRKKVDFEEVLASASAGAKTPGKPKNAPYGKIKAEIRDRFVTLRAQGMTLAQTVNLSGGKVTENQILNIMNGSKVGMDAYNAIEDAMNKWEQVTASAAAAETDSTTE